MNFKINSRPFFKLKNYNFKTRDFSPLIERVLAGVGAARKIFGPSYFVTSLENLKCSCWENLQIHNNQIIVIECVSIELRVHQRKLWEID